MSYTEYVKQIWDTTSYVNPTRMNHIEDGIKSNSDGISSLNTDLAKRFLTYPTSLYSGTHGWDVARATTLLNWIATQTSDGDYGVVTCNNGYLYSGTFIRGTANDIIVNFNTYRDGYSGYLLQKASGTVTVSQFMTNSDLAKTVGYITSSNSTIVNGSYAHKSGNVVTLLVYATNCTNEVFATLPQGYRPTERTLVVGYGGTSASSLSAKLVSLNPNGAISNAHDSTVHSIWILHCTYVV